FLQCLPDAKLASAHRRDHPVQLPQLHPQDRRTQFIHPVSFAPQAEVWIVEDEPTRLVPAVTHVVTGEGPMIEPSIIGNDAASFSGAHVLVHLKTENGHVTEGSYPLAVDGSSVRLSAILKEPEALPTGHIPDCLDVAWCPAHVDHDHSLGPRCDALPDVDRI